MKVIYELPVKDEDSFEMRLKCEISISPAVVFFFRSGEENRLIVYMAHHQNKK